MAINKLKPTPVLSGASATRFKRIAEENRTKTVSREEVERVMGIYNKVSQNTKTYQGNC